MVKRLKYLASIALILSGVLMTVISAVMSNYTVTQNNHDIETLKAKAQSIEQTIMQLWQDYQLLEQKKDTATLLIAQDSAQEYFQPFLNDVLTTLNVKVTTVIMEDRKQLFALLLHKMAQNKQKTVDQINDIYGEKLDLLSQARALELKNSHLSNIALFFQIMGLILVLSKHFFD